VNQASENIHTIFLDVGGTLLRAHPSVGEIYAEVAAEHGIAVDSAEVQQNVRGTFWQKLLKRRSRGEMSPQTGSIEGAKDFWREVVRGGLGEAAEHQAFDTYFEDVFEQFSHARRYRFFDEAHDVLKGLRDSGYRLGIISNWDTRLRTVLEEFEVTDMFDPIIISGEVGHEKPFSEIFQIARKRAGARSADRLLQVGDSFYEDYEAAIAAGFEARHIDRSKGQTLMTALEDLIA